MADARYGRLAAGPGRPEHAAGLPQCSAVRHRKGGLPEDSAVRPVRAACRKDAAVAPAGGSPETPSGLTLVKVKTIGDALDALKDIRSGNTAALP
ncbi:hypothetical protein ACWDA8_41800, partial [Streptomyces sp. NPDC001130]